MNISDLQVNQKIKNYRELCNLTDLTVKSGKSKKIQLNKLERLCKYHKDGNAFIIDEIYNVPLPAVGKATGNNTKYIAEIQDILIDYIYNNCSEQNNVVISFSSLINILGLANSTYKNGNYKKRELSKVLDIKLPAIWYFYSNSRGEFRRIIERALNNLQRKSILEVDKCYVIFKNEENILKMEKANEIERGMIIDARHNALKQLGLRDLQELLFSGKATYKQFNKLVMDYLPKEWTFYYQAYVLAIGREAIKDEYLDIQQRKLELNTKSVERMETCLKVVNRESEQMQLIDKLISLIDYDNSLDEKINTLYRENKAEYYRLLSEKNKKIYRLEQEMQELSQQEEIKEEINKIDLQIYSDSIKTQKSNYDFNAMEL